MAVKDHSQQFSNFESLKNADFVKESFGERNFHDLAAKLRDCYRMISDIIAILDASLAEGDITLFSTYKNNVVDYIDRFVVVTEPILKASIDKATGDIVQWVKSIRADADEFIQRVYSRVPTNYPESDLRMTYAAVVSARKNIGKNDNSDSSEAIKKLNVLIEQAEDARNTLKNAAGSSAAQALGEFYEHESNVNSANKNGNARKWLISGFIFLSAFIILIIVLGINPTATLFSCNQTSTEEMRISFIIERLLLLSAMAFITRFTFRQYAIRMHASSAYKQKAALAKTFERLLNTPRAQDRIDLVVAEVINSLSAFVPTGFIRKDEPVLNPLSEIANLIMSSKSKKD